MATNKFISQLTGSVSPALSGYTVYDDGTKTYKLSLTNLRNAIVPGLTSYATTGSNTFNGNQLIKGDIVISGSLTAQQYIISSSVTHITNQSLNGSSVFGNSMDDTHLFTGSVSITGSLRATSLIGDGSGLTNLSNITGSVNKLAFVSADKQINTPYFAHIINSGNGLGLGTSAYFSPAPERLMVDNGQSFNIATFQTSRQESYAEVNIKNFGSGSNSSADLVIWNDRSTESSSYVNLGINSSNYSGIDVGYGGDGYLINASNDLYVGSTEGGEHGHTHIFAGNLWNESSISVYNDGTVGFNTDYINNDLNTIPSSGDGYRFEFNGHIKSNDDLKVEGHVEVGKIRATGSLTLQPDLEDGRTIEIYNTSPSDIHIKGNAAYTFLGDDTTYVKLDANDETITINTNNGVGVYGDTNIYDNLTVSSTIYGNEIQNNGQDLNIKAYYPNNLGLWSEGGTVNVTGSLNVNDDVSANYFYGDGSQLTNVATSVTGEWVLSPGTNNVSFTVTAGHTYTMWVNGNIPNGIVVWNATVTTSNTNVPVVGSQYAWYYSSGNNLVFTSIPNQIVGSNGTIISSPISYNSNDSNVFKFGITNNSNEEQTINWGYTKI